MAENSTENSEKRRRGPGIPFLPGQSGNPGGRPPVPPEVKEGLAALLPRSVEVLQELLGESGKPLAEPRLALEAAQTVQNRVLGKPETILRMEQQAPVSPPVFNIRRMEPGEFKASTEHAPAGTGNGQSDSTHNGGA